MKEIRTDRAPAAIGPYSQAIEAGDKIFTSGVIPVDPKTGEISGADAPAQARQAFENLRALLEAAGSGLEKVVKTTVFLKDIKDFAAMNKVYSEFFKTDCSARSAVQIAALPKDGLVEIEVIAEA